MSDAAGHLAHGAEPFLLEHLLLRRLQLDEGFLEHPMALLQGRLGAVARGDVLEAHDHTRQLVALDHRRAHVVDRKVGAVHPGEDLVARLMGLAVVERSQHRRVLVEQSRAVGGEVMHDLADPLADGRPRVDSQDGGGGRIDEDDPPLGIDSEDAFAGGFQDERGLRVRALVEAPGDDAAHARPEHEQRVDAGPGPRRVDRGLVVVHGLGPEHADDAVVDRDEGDGQEVRDPVLAESQEREHDEEVEVKFDVAAG